MEDCTDGKRIKATAGDVVWIPKHSKTRIISSHDVEAFYVDQRQFNEEESLDFDPSSQGGSVEARLLSHERRLTANMIAMNPQSRKIHEEASKVMPGGNTRSVLHGVPFPISFRGGSGVTITSVDGKQYLDCVSEYSAAMFGHTHPLIQQAIHITATDGFNLGGPSIYEVRLAKHLCSRFKSLDLVRFCNSGTEANTMCLIAAKAYTGRKKVR